ncbi:ATP-binding protein [candidate division KSB1 bacterium]
MNIAIASGKGGTGKTTVATNLAIAAGKKVTLMDCDVENPNCHIFLSPVIRERVKISIPVPKVDMERCSGCGECGVFCQFNAIVYTDRQILFYPDLCHGCGGCSLICPEHAISEIDREIGVVEKGTVGDIQFIRGILNVGEALVTPLVRAVRKEIRNSDITIIDSPPGTSCPVIESIRNTDYVILVTEPTLFGINDLALAVKLVRELNIPFGVVNNQVVKDNSIINDFCFKENIPILLEIPDDRNIAEAYSRGVIAGRNDPKMLHRFRRMLSEIVNGTYLKSSDFFEPLISLRE